MGGQNRPLVENHYSNFFQTWGFHRHKIHINKVGTDGRGQSLGSVRMFNLEVLLAMTMLS